MWRGRRERGEAREMKKVMSFECVSFELIIFNSKLKTHNSKLITQNS
jgi:hypothetical protein